MKTIFKPFWTIYSSNLFESLDFFIFSLRHVTTTHHINFFYKQGNYTKGIFTNNVMAKIIWNQIVSNDVMENLFESVKLVVILKTVQLNLQYIISLIGRFHKYVRIKSIFFPLSNFTKYSWLYLTLIKLEFVVKTQHKKVATSFCLYWHFKFRCFTKLFDSYIPFFIQMKTDHSWHCSLLTVGSWNKIACEKLVKKYRT